ncbi:MAG: ribonuclease III [Chthonomonadales bacterium]
MKQYETPACYRSTLPMNLPENHAQLQLRLKLKFKDVALLEHALRHRSAVPGERSVESNERLEFLGDSVVGMVISNELFLKFPAVHEGFLAKAKAFIVSEPTLYQAAIDIGLNECVQLGAHEDEAGGRLRPSILSDAFEALIGAIFLDCGITTARRVVRNSLKFAIDKVKAGDFHRDFKSALQEYTQSINRKTPTYVIIDTVGTEHNLSFTSEARLGKKVLGSGSGRSKKEAQQAAARDALDRLPTKPKKSKKS